MDEIMTGQAKRCLNEPCPPDNRDDCPFCDIIRHISPAEVVRRWDDAIAFRPFKPVSVGHTLVVPIRHIDTFLDDPDITAATMRRASELTGSFKPGTDNVGWNLITSAGELATQTIRHFHVHIVCRTPNDGLKLPWTKKETQ